MTSRQPYPWKRSVRLLAGVTLLASPLHAQSTTDTAPTQPNARRPASSPATPESGAGGDDETITLSPFTVDATKDKGYYAANTLAGSRLKTNISDLGASISVVTKQQLVDTGSLDINDVFRYESNTEGSGTYTPSGAGYGTLRNDGIVDANGGAAIGSSTVPFTNATANRVRGIGVPTSAINYYPSISQIPFDSYNVQSVEISRGPNSMLFGLGSPAGIVNQTTAQAALNKNNANVTLRFDNYGSNRASLSFNRTLISDKLAIYGAFLYDDRAFARKPSYDLTRRQYGAITIKPFAKTTIRANVEGYRNDNRRPNSLTPRDFVTQWNLAGKPSYDPVTKKVTVNGKEIGPYIINASSPYANDVRNYIQSLPNYNAALWNSDKTTYNGQAIFGTGQLTSAAGFVAGGTPSNNALFVPGIGYGTVSRTIMQIQGGQLQGWFQPLNNQKYRTEFGTAANPAATAPLFPTDAAIYANPTWADYYNRDYTASAGWTGLGNGIAGGSYKYPSVTNKAIYDWTKTNIAQMNFGRDKNANYNVEFEQEILSNLYLSGGWFRQDFDSVTNYTVAQLNVTTLFVDTNKNNMDGTPNPYFGKPYVLDFDPDRFSNSQTDDHYRAMLAWTPDFRQNRGWTRWLGHHQILGLWSRDKSDATSLRQRLEYLGSSSLDGRTRYMNNPNNNADGTPTGWNFQSTSLQRFYYLAAPGDSNGVVTRSSGEWNPLSYNGSIKVYDYAASQFKTVDMQTAFNTFEAGTGRTQRIVDSISAGMTNYLWQDRLVATFGVRKDKYKARSTTNDIIKDERGNTIAPLLTNAEKWSNGYYLTDTLLKRFNRWDRLEGTTRTLGGVFRPFRNWSGIENRAHSSLFYEFVRDFGVSYNKSDNFNPPASAQVDPLGNPLGKPTGQGKDIGLQFSLFNNKLFARVTWFNASNQNERGSPGTAISRLTDNVDQTLFRGWARTIAMINMGMDPTLTGFGTGLSPAVEQQVKDAAEKIWKIPYTYYSQIGSIGATRNAKAKGVEAEVNYNPTPNWTMKFTFGKQATYYYGVLKEFDILYNFRNPVWQAAKAADYLLPQYQNLATYTTAGGRPVNLTNFWTSYGFDTNVRLDEPSGNTNVDAYYRQVVFPQAQLARDLEGQQAPGQRKYRWSYLTSYTFREGLLKGFIVGGSERWESKSVIGYFGRASGANGTLIDVSDVGRPIYDSPNWYTDLMVAYTRKVLRDKVGMRVQLNVYNVFEKGYLRPVAVNYNGEPYSFRIVDPRQFSLTTSFDF